jgi:photosystem II stability/assembly factor-like uncharacterized protein
MMFLTSVLVALYLVLPDVAAGGSDTWTSIGPQGKEVFAVAIDPAMPTTLYVGTDSGVFKSTNAGGSWSPVNAGLTFRVRLLAIDPHTPTTLYAGINGGGIFKSTNGGGSWSAASTGLISLSGVPASVQALAIDPQTPTTVYAAAEGGVFKSTNGGNNWSVILNYHASAVAIDPQTPTTLYVGLGGTVLKSLDGGGSWREMNAGLFDNIPSYDDILNVSSSTVALSVDPRTPTNLYVGINRWILRGNPYDGNAWTEDQSFVFKSTDGGESWSAVLFWDNVYAWPLAIDPQTPTTVYAGSNWGGVAKSTDGGLSWTASLGGPVHALALDPLSPTTVYAGTPAGVFVTTPATSEAQFILSLSTVGSGTITASPAPVSGTYAAGTVVSLTATPASGSQFGGWSGACSGTGACSVTMDAAKSVTATFSALPPPPDTSPPDTSIISAADGTGTALANDAVTLSTSLTLSFTGTDNVGLSRFECKLDGAGFSVCASPRAYNALALGHHTFEVRAVDTSSNVDATPARYSWTVDAAPETTINSAVDGRGKSIVNGGSTPSDKVTFRFAGTDNGTVAGFECLLDAGNFTSCTSPVTYTAVTRGAHTFRVRAVDNNAFRDPSPATFTWRR